jgi:hypothetical protein
VAALLLALCASAAQAEPDAGALPRGWFIGGADPSSYTVESTSGQCSERAAVLGSRPSAKPAGAVTVMQLFRADNYRGKRVRFSAAVRTTGVLGWAGLWIRVDGLNKKTLAFDNMQRRPLSGTTACARQQTVVDVAPEAEFIALGLLLDGQGSAELGTISLEVVDPGLVASTNLLDAPSVLGPPKDPREEPAIGRVGNAWFGQRTIGGYLNLVGPGLWRWKDSTSASLQGQTVTVEQGLALPALGADPLVAPMHGTFTVRRDDADTVIEGEWGTALHSYPVTIRYSRKKLDMQWGFYQRHLTVASAPQLEAGCVYFANRSANALYENDRLTLCGAALAEAPPPVQTVVAFLWTGFKRTYAWQLHELPR